MAHISMESVAEVGEEEVVRAPTPDEPYERPTKGKTRRKLLQSLQRVSSSQSLARLGRTSTGTYRGTGKGSISCISLSSSSYNNALATPVPPQVSNGYFTAPTSVPGTPAQEPVTSDADARIRVVDRDGARSIRPSTTSSIPVPSEAKILSRPATSAGKTTTEYDYFSKPIIEEKAETQQRSLDFWGELPQELKMHIFRLLDPKEIVRCSRVSKQWHKMCFDGQLWADMDASKFYSKIPADSLIRVIKNAGPFVRDLNLRGCIQLCERWRNSGLADACSNLENLSLEGCRIDRHSIHSFLYENKRLVHINFSGLQSVSNYTMRILSQCCQRLEVLNVSWCINVETRGLRRVIENCENLRDLRAGEIRGFDDIDFMNELFKKNKLERLMLMNCDSLNDDSLSALIEGTESQVDFLTGRRIVPPRLLRHLDISSCRNVSDAGMKALVHNVPYLEGLRLSKCRQLTDASLTELLPTLQSLTHLDLEEVDLLTNQTLQHLAKSPCKDYLQHLSISNCENMGDVGMLPVIKTCPNLRNLDLDNTRISDLVLAEAAAMVRRRCSPDSTWTRARSVTWDGASAPTSTSFNTSGGPVKPKVGLRMVVYDCQNVTWTGIREVLSRNAEIKRPMPPSFVLPSFAPATTATATFSSQQDPTSNTSESLSRPLIQTTTLQQPQQTAPSHPHQIIWLKVFYGYQPTVQEHTDRVMRGDFASASRLERKWAEYMMASEEAGAAMGVGTGNGLGNANAGLAGLGLMGNRRRRRRVREAQMMHADEEEGGGAFGPLGTGVGRRRRARSGGGCFVM